MQPRRGGRSSRTRSAEGEHVPLGSGRGEGDLEGPVSDLTVLADQLVEPLFGDGAIARLVNVEAAGAIRRLAVDQHDEGDRLSGAALGAQHQIEIPPVEAVYDPAARLVQRRDLSLDRPVAGQRPLVELELWWRVIDGAAFRCDTAERGEATGPGIADVGLR